MGALEFAKERRKNKNAGTATTENLAVSGTLAFALARRARAGSPKVETSSPVVSPASPAQKQLFDKTGIHVALPEMQPQTVSVKKESEEAPRAGADVQKPKQIGEALREGNPVYNDGVKDNGYSQFRPAEDIQYEIDSTKKNRDTDLLARDPKVKDIYARASRGQETAEDRAYMSDAVRKYAEENDAYDAKIKALEEELKQSKRKAVLQRRESAKQETNASEKSRYSADEIENAETSLENIGSAVEKSNAEYEKAAVALESKRTAAYAALREYESELEQNGIQKDARSGQYLISDSKYNALRNACTQIDLQIAALKRENQAVNENAKSQAYFLQAAKTMSPLSDDERTAILRGIAAEGNNGLIDVGEWIDTDARIFDLDSGSYKTVSRAEYNQIIDAYNSALDKLRQNGASDADIERVKKAVGISVDRMKAGEMSVETAKTALMMPVTSSIVSVPMSVVGGAYAAVGETARGVGNLFRPDGYNVPMNTSGAAYLPTSYANAIRGTIGERIEEGNGVAGKIGSFVYQTVMSSLDSIAAASLGNIAGATAIGLGAGANAVIDAKERGVTDNQALATGIAAAIFETLFEKVSIGEFNALKEVPPATWRDVAKNVVKSTLVNASEEAATETANIVADYLINGDLSGYGEAYSNYIKQGYDKSKACYFAFLDMAKQVGLSAAGGALQGAGMGGIGSAWGYIANRGANSAAGTYFTDGGKMDEESVSALIGEGLASTNEEIRNYAKSLEGKKVDERQAGQLYRMLVAESQNSQAVGKDEEKGGEQLVFTEQTLTQNKYAVSEMQPVSRITGEEFQKGEVDLLTQVANFFKSLNNKAFNEEIGSVTVDRRGAKADIAHGIGRKKAASFQSVFDVINNGKVVDYQTNWKGRGYDTAVVAAPITIGGAPYYMGVVLTRNHGENRFYVHEVFATDENGTSPFKTGTTANDRAPGEDAPSVINILNSIAKVKENAKKDTDMQIAAADGENEMPDFSDRSLDEPISDAEFRQAYEARIRRQIAAEKAKAEADTELGAALSGKMTDERARRIVSDATISAEFEALTGVKLTGTTKSKTEQVKRLQLLAAEELRTRRADERVKALSNAGTRDQMDAALGTSGKALYDANYDAGVSGYRMRGLQNAEEQYNESFGAYYKQGYTGSGFDYLSGAVIDEATARQIYEAGRRDAKSDRYLNATERSAFECGVSKEKTETALRLSQAIGKDIIFLDAGEDFNGCAKDGVIYIGANSSRSIISTVAHEYTHLLEKKGLYGRLQGFVFDTLAEEGKEEAQLREAKRREHKIYEGMKDEELDMEIVASFVETRLLTDEKTMIDLTRREGKSFAQRLLDTLNSLIEKIKAAFSDVLHKDGNAREQLDILERGRALLAEVIRSEDNITVKNGDETISFSGIDSLSEQVRQALAGEMPPRRSVYFGKTPNLLIKLGLKQKPLLASPSHMRENSLSKDIKHSERHGITQEQFEKLPQKIAHPVMVMDSLSRKDSIVIVTDMFDGDGFPIIVSINTNGEGFYKLETELIPANFITSAHGRSNFFGNKGTDFITNNIDNNTFLYIDKEKSQNLFSVLGVQFPVRLNSFGFDKIIRQSRNVVNSQSMQNSENDAGKMSHSAGGPKAATADIGRLEQAERMESDGASSEEIRQATGWYKGYDGKWRFEINDRKMRFIGKRDSVRKLRRLDELIQHDELFAAYPELREYTVLMFDMGNDTNGSFRPKSKKIVLNPNLSRQEKRIALIHEIQHAIQNIEGFAVGSTTDYWDKLISAGYDTRPKDVILEENELLEQWDTIQLNEPEFFKEMSDFTASTPNEPRGKVDFATLEQIEEDPPAWKRFDAERDALIKRYGAEKVFDFMELSAKIQQNAMKGRRSASDLYMSTAGEIEARDAEKRISYTEKQRKNTRPDIDRTDVVFASDSGGWYRAEYDPETAGIKEQLEHSAKLLNAMEVAVSIKVPTDFASKEDAAKWAIKELKNTGYQVDRQGYGIIIFNENDIKGGINYADTVAEKAALVAIPRVLKRGVEIGHHGNHKSRGKQTITLAAPVELNGIRGNMAVVVNKRGNHYYAHRIVLPDGNAFVFEENKNDATRESSRGVTVSSSLAETTSVASIDSIPNPDKIVNGKSKNNEKEKSGMQFSVGGGDSDAKSDSDAVTDTDKRFAPVESAIKLLKGGKALTQVVRDCGVKPLVLAMRMAANGESDKTIRELTGLYRYSLGVWVFDGDWLDEHIPDLYENRETRKAYFDGAIEKKLIDLGVPENREARKRLLGGGATAEDSDRLSRTANNLHRGLRPTVKEFGESRAKAAAKEAARLMTDGKNKIPTVDAATRTGALLSDIADVLEKSYRSLSESERAAKILKLTAQYKDEAGKWTTDEKALTDLIRKAGKDIGVQEFTDFLFDNAAELTEADYNSRYKMRDTYALSKLGVKIQNPIVDIAAHGAKPSELIANEREQYELKRYIERDYENAVHPTPVERDNARGIAAGTMDFSDISPNARREVVLDLVYTALARRGLKDNGIESFYAMQKQRYAEELASKIFATPIEPGKKPVWQLTLTLNTPVRNNRLVFGEEVGRYLNETIFEKVVENEAERYRFLQREIEKIAALELNKSESAAVQMLAEATEESMAAYSELLKTDSKYIDIEKVRDAVTVFRECYNLYYDAINEFLVMHGYKPIGFQKNYMPRLQKEADISALRESLTALGIETEEVTELPAEIAGRTEQFKPGKKYNPFFEHRTSKNNENVQYDALAGFDSYITYLSEVLYHTDDIQKLRTLNNAIRERYASANTSKRITELKEKLYSPDPDRDIAQIEADLAKAYDDVKNNQYFGTYVTWLDEYTNGIAGKQSKADRNFEAFFGRKALNLGKKLNNIYCSAAITGNLSSVIMQTAQLPFAIHECGKWNMIRALIDILPGNDRLNKTTDFDKKSTFLTGKRGVKFSSEPALGEKVKGIGNYLFESVDMKVSQLIVRAKFFEVLKKNPNISFDDALREADRYISALVGNRMKGAKPVLFNAKNIIYRAWTSFQLEQLNFVEYVAKDVAPEYRKYWNVHGPIAGFVKIARKLLGALVGVFIFNRLVELICGKTPAPMDMIGMIVDSLGAGWNLTGNDFLLTLTDNLLDAMTGERKLGTKPIEKGDFSSGKAVYTFFNEFADDIPLASNVLAMFGFTDSQLPIPRVGAAVKTGKDALFGKFDAENIPDYIIDDLSTWVPFGNQIKKSKRGVELIENKGMYNKSGKLMFASDMNMWDSIRAVLFGPSANEEYQESFFGGRYLSATETEMWKQMLEAGAKPEESFDALQDVYDAGVAVKEADAEATSAEVKAAKIAKIDDLPLNGKVKALIFYGDVATSSEKEIMDTLEVKLQVDSMKVYNFMSAFAMENGVVAKREYLKQDRILSDSEKAAVYYDYFADDDEQDFIDELTRRGSKAADIYKMISATYTADGRVSAAERADAIRESRIPASAKEEAMYTLISENLYDDYSAVQSAGGSIDEFLSAYAVTRGVSGDKDKNGKTVALSKSRKLKKAIDDALPNASKKVKQALYKAFDVSEKVW